MFLVQEYKDTYIFYKDSYYFAYDFMNHRRTHNFNSLDILRDNLRLNTTELWSN